MEKGTDELKQTTAAIRAAKDAGVQHLIWSTLPNVEAISGGKFHIPAFTGRAKIDRMVKEAEFANYTFVMAPFYYQNLMGVLGPQKQADGSSGWALPLDPDVRCLHMGDISDLGNIVAGALAHPDEAGNGEYLPLVGDFVSFNEIVDTLNRQGHKFSFNGECCDRMALSPDGRTMYVPSFEGMQAGSKHQAARRTLLADLERQWEVGVCVQR